MMTAKQRLTFDFLAGFHDQNGFMPSYEEIMQGTGRSTKSGICKMLHKIQSLGYIQKISYRARAIEITEKGYDLLRRAARVDDNQTEIVKDLRGVYATVTHLHAVGDGCPDILVGYKGINYLMEIKDGDKPPSDRKLTKPQVAWHRDWRGTVHVVLSSQEAFAVLGLTG